MRKKLVYVVLGVWIFVNTGNVFAWGWFHWDDWFGINNKSIVRIGNIGYKLEKQIDRIDKRLKENEAEWMQKLSKKKNEVMQRGPEKQKKLEGKIKKNLKLKEIIEKIEEEGKVAKLLEIVAAQPISKLKGGNVVKKKIKTILEKKLKNLPNQTADLVSNTVINKLGGFDNIQKFSLTDNFDPEKVVTFDDIKDLAIKNLTLYKSLLGCEDPDESVVNLCEGITNLLDDLTADGKKLTINDVYKLQLYQSTIAQAIYYEGTLKEFKKGAIVLGVDKVNNQLKSFDVVRSYTTYDTQNNDILPIVAKNIDIDVTSTKPSMEGNDIKIVLGLKSGSLVGLKIYPVDKDVTIPYANMYKVMTIEGFTRGCVDNKYTDSLWYGYGKIGLSHDGKNLEPNGTKGVKFNLEERCYEVFSKGS